MRDEEGVEDVQNSCQIGEQKELMGTMRGDVVRDRLQSVDFSISQQIPPRITLRRKTSFTRLSSTFHFQRADERQAWPMKKKSSAVRSRKKPSSRTWATNRSSSALLGCWAWWASVSASSLAGLPWEVS